MHAVKLAYGLTNLLLIGNGVKYGLEKKHLTAAKLITAGLVTTYLSPYNHFNMDSLHFYGSAGLGAACISNFYEEKKRKGICQLLLGSAAMALHLRLFKPDEFLSNPWVCGLLVSTALTGFSGLACWIADQMSTHKKVETLNKKSEEQNSFHLV